MWCAVKYRGNFTLILQLPV